MVIQEKSCLKVVSYIIYRGVGLSLVIDGFFETAWTIRIDGGSGWNSCCVSASLDIEGRIIDCGISKQKLHWGVTNLRVEDGSKSFPDCTHKIQRSGGDLILGSLLLSISERWSGYFLQVSLFYGMYPPSRAQPTQYFLWYFSSYVQKLVIKRHNSREDLYGVKYSLIGGETTDRECSTYSFSSGKFWC